MRIVGVAFVPERSVERVQQKIDHQRVGACVWILQRRTQGGNGADLFVTQHLSNRVLIRGFAMGFPIKAAIIGTVKTVAPVADKAMGQYAAMVATMAVIVGAGKRRKDRL